MRQVYTESQKRKFVKAYEESSLTIRDYCRSVNISPSLFYQTRKSLIKEESLNKKVSSSPLFHQIVKPRVGVWYFTNTFQWNQDWSGRHEYGRLDPFAV